VYQLIVVPIRKIARRILCRALAHTAAGEQKVFSPRLGGKTGLSGKYKYSGGA